MGADERSDLIQSICLPPASHEIWGVRKERIPVRGLRQFLRWIILGFLF